MAQIKYFIVAGLVALGLQAHAQGQGYPDIGQKWLSRPLINPAATGNTPFLEMSLFARQQWLGVDGAPATQIFLGHYLFPDINSGMGLMLTNEYIGLFHTFDIKLAYAYHFRLAQDISISFGLAGNATWMFRDDSRIELQDQVDKSTIPPLKTTMLPNFDAGMELRNAWLRVGLSATHLINSPKNYDNPTLADYTIPDIEHTLPAYVSCRKDAHTEFAISPTLSTSLNHGFYDGEAGALFFYKRQRPGKDLVRLNARYNNTYDFLWAGGFMRFSGTMVLMAGFSMSEHWRLGYAYEHTFRYQSFKWLSSHEIMLSWRISPIRYGPRRYLCEDC
jgi:type IX secretion system PorP/SprF family membrane protein